MEYNSILQQVEEQEKEKRISGKMFRYSGLILAVDFFSQKLNSEQILTAAFDFVNELLMLENSYEFSSSGDSYLLSRTKGVPKDLDRIESNELLANLPVLNGNVLVGSETILKYFSPELLEAYQPEIIIPIIAERDLEGFILIPQRTDGSYDDDDIIICEVLMKLFNGSMANFRSYTELHSINESLDEKIFNLFAINQSSRALLSELNLDNLYSLSIDVFSELTQSSSTGFVLFDDKIEKYSLKAYKLIYDNSKVLSIEMDMERTAKIDPNRIIVDLSKEQDQDYFNSLFPDGVKMLEELAPRYLVLLNRDAELLGFVTLGSTVTGLDYRQSVFELIESLASSTYISISNARHFEQVNQQKALIQNKLNRLISLNNLTKNINSSENMDTLLEITLKTLGISFGAEKCLLALYDDKGGTFSIKESYGMDCCGCTIEQGRSSERLFRGRTALAFNKAEFGNYFKCAENLFDGLETALIVPIYLDKSEIELLGVMIVFEFRGSLISDEENVLTMETIAGHIAPILYSLKVIEEQSALRMPNYLELFKNDLRREIAQAQEYNLDLSVLKICNPVAFSFCCPDMAGMLGKKFSRVYPLSYNTVFVIINEKVNDGELSEELCSIMGIPTLTLKMCVFGRDFKSVDDFLA